MSELAEAIANEVSEQIAEAQAEAEQTEALENLTEAVETLTETLENQEAEPEPIAETVTMTQLLTSQTAMQETLTEIKTLLVAEVLEPNESDDNELSDSETPLEIEIPAVEVQTIAPDEKKSWNPWSLLFG